MVAVARASAGLWPGTNFSAPNQRNTIPRLSRKSVMPFFAIQSKLRASSRR